MAIKEITHEHDWSKLMIAGEISLITHPHTGIIRLAEINMTIFKEILLKPVPMMQTLQNYLTFHLHWSWHCKSALMWRHGSVYYVQPLWCEHNNPWINQILYLVLEALKVFDWVSRCPRMEYTPGIHIIVWRKRCWRSPNFPYLHQWSIAQKRKKSTIRHRHWIKFLWRPSWSMSSLLSKVPLLI